MKTLLLLFVWFAVIRTCFQLQTNPDAVSALSQGMMDDAEKAVTLSLNLVGILALLLGIFKIAEDAGIIEGIARLLKPVLVRLFPEVPANHPAMGAMVMNLSANMLGTGNAATPFGLKAMKSLAELNKHPGIITPAMILFLAINASSVTLVPTKVIALRAAAGSAMPGAVLSTILFGTCCSTLVAILIAKSFERYHGRFTPASPGAALSTLIMPLIGFGVFIALVLNFHQGLGQWLLPGLMISILSYGMYKKIDIYQSFIDGAKEGLNIAVQIVPFGVIILVIVGMLRTSGCIEGISTILSPFTTPIGLPPEALPMALLRPISGSGSLGLLSASLADPAIGPDSYTGLLISTMMGSTETTFYVIAVYTAAACVSQLRYLLVAALGADAISVLASLVATNLFYGDKALALQLGIVLGGIIMALSLFIILIGPISRALNSRGSALSRS